MTISLPFTKMHGIGNDFVVLDGRHELLAIAPERVRRLGDRRFGIGFDQLLTIEPATEPGCAFRYRIYNQDGSEALQCGNGVRCIAAWLYRDGALGRGPARLQGPAGPVGVELLGDGRVAVNMGVPNFDPAAIPLRVAAEADRYTLALDGQIVAYGALSMGNPHAVITVIDVDQAPVATLGPRLERHVNFPERCNVGFAQIIDSEHIRLRVWERGVGETLACGTGACAAVAVLRRHGRVEAQVGVSLPGGELKIRWPGAGQDLWMEGPAAFVYEGTV